MTPAATQTSGVDEGPANSVESGRRSSFKVPAPLNMTDEISDRNVWSPSRRHSSIIANGDLWSSNSPRTTPPPPLVSQASGSSTISSPKNGTPARFEDPLLAMPSFRRNSASPTLDLSAITSTSGPPSYSPTVLSPSLRGGLSSSNSFSARRTHIDFRSSVPGAATPSAAVSIPGDVITSTRPISARQHGSLSRGNMDLGHVDLLGYSSPFVGSESGGPGLDDEDETEDPEGHEGVPGRLSIQSQGQHASAAATAAAAAAAAAAGISVGGIGVPNRRHSAFVMRSPGSLVRFAGTSPVGRLAERASEDEEFMARLQQNRSSWRGRQRAGGHGTMSMNGGGTSGQSEGGLQNQTHAALEQLRGELRSLSVKSMHAVPETVTSMLSPAAAGAAVTGGGGGGSGAAAGATATSGPVGAGTGGGSDGRGGCPSSRPARLSEGHTFASPSRLSVGGYPRSSSIGGAVGGARQELFPPRQAMFHSAPDAHTQAAALAIRTETTAAAADAV